MTSMGPGSRRRNRIQRRDPHRFWLAEIDQHGAELERVLSEGLGLEDALAYAAGEGNRGISEDKRQGAERLRLAAEEARHVAEQLRVMTEEARKTAEMLREAHVQQQELLNEMRQTTAEFDEAARHYHLLTEQMKKDRSNNQLNK